MLSFCMNCLQKTTHAQMARIPFRGTYTLILIASSIVGTSKRHLLYRENDTSILLVILPITFTRYSTSVGCLQKIYSCEIASACAMRKWTKLRRNNRACSSCLTIIWELEWIPSVLPWSSNHLTRVWQISENWNICLQNLDGEVIISSRLQESTQETVKTTAWKMNHFHQACTTRGV